ncbi:ATPase inhibitor subunit zeta (plasmid) [Methylobacterium sp. CM6241]
MTRFFEERERAAEMLFVRSEEARFRVHAQGVQSLANYAAQALGVDYQSAVAYADELMSSVIHGAKDNELIERVRADLEANGVAANTAVLAQQLKQPPTQRAYDVHRV